jgi:Zn-finger nucleic acid-binding protein
MSDNKLKVCPRCNGEMRVYVEYTQAFRRQRKSKIAKCPQCDGNGFLRPESPILTDKEFYDMAKRAKAQ